MAPRQHRTHSWQETQANVRRAKQLTERYGLGEASAADYQAPLSSTEQSAWDDLLRQIK